MSSSSTVHELTKAISATIINEYKKCLVDTASGALAGNDTAKAQLLPLIQSWSDQAAQHIGAGLGNLTVTVTGLPGATSGVGGFPPQQQPQFASVQQQQQFPPAQQNFGFPPQQQAAAQPAFGGGQAGAVPPKCSASLQGCGVTRVPLTHQNQGCTCGVEHSTKGYTGNFFCISPGDSQNMHTQTWTCSKHKNRPTLDLKKGAAKKSGGGGGAVVSAQQVNGLRQPVGFPAQFSANPGLAGGLANAMAQQPQGQNFGGQQFGGFNAALIGAGGGAPPPVATQMTISNPQLSSQLMNNMHTNLNSIPQQNSALPGGAGFNMNQLMQQAPAQGVSVGQPAFTFPSMGGANPMAAFGGAPMQILPQQTAAPASGSSDDDDDGESSEDDPIDVVPQANVAAALANAMSLGAPTQVAAPQQQQQAPQQNFGGLALPGNGALNAALQNAQQAPPQQQPAFNFPAPTQTSAAAAPNPMAALIQQAVNAATHA